eukprot:Colp12_sorted_trinity150504_noHs@30346
MSFYRNTVWFFNGLRHYTKSGYEQAAKTWPKDDNLEVDLKGKSFLITGANAGLGKETAFNFAKNGGQVHMVCRNKELGEEARREIVEATKNEDVHLHILDMSQPLDVIHFVDEFLQKNEKLDVLVNNAGVMLHKRELNSEGFELNFSTNTLGPFLMTELLLPVLQKAKDGARVITVSSGGMLLEKLDPDDLQSEKMNPFEGTRVYSLQKRQQVVLTELWQKKYGSSGVSFYSMHPGWADTKAVAKSIPQFKKMMDGRLRDPKEGADTIVWLGSSPRVTPAEGGKFFQDRVAVATHLPLAWTRSTAEEEERLYTNLTSMLAALRAKASSKPESS